MRSLKIVVPSLLATGALLLTGCSSTDEGSGSPAGASRAASGSSSASTPQKPSDAKSFVSDSLDAFEKAPAAHVSGSGESDGESIALDLKYGADVAIGTLTLAGKEVEISKVEGGTVYFKAGADFWTSVGVPDSAVATLDGKYVQIDSTTQGFSDLAKLLDRNQFADAFRPDDSDLDGAEVGGPKEVNGVSCWSVEDSDGKGAFYAAAEGDPLPVQLKAGTEGTFDFDGYTDTVDVPTPDPADVVKLPSS
ncbi:hypothetical protein ACXR2U_05595 [Jatrophihabitans sp. YIM 134969]